MDPTRFDALARALVSGGTRRRILAVLAALPLGGTLLALDDDEAAAERPRDRLMRRNQQRKRQQRNNPKKKNTNKNKNKNNKKKGGQGGANPGACTPNGQACQQNRDCCGGNCFNQRCADPVTSCGNTDCPAGATGCCAVEGCCQAPANQCNAAGDCCAPNCAGKQCGPDGCGNTGACGACTNVLQICDEQTGRCEGDTCGVQSCPTGCCDDNDTCQTGPGHGSCDPRPPGPCCSGCCDGVECQPGTDAGLCGAGGEVCRDCLLDGLACDQGTCVCTAASCPDGCCHPGPGGSGIICVTGDRGFCGAGGVPCKLVNGSQCAQDSDCCSDNCFGGVCADTVTECGGTACAKLSRGCCGTTCCDDAATCCGTGASCQNHQCICDAQLCGGCCEQGPGNPGRCLENAPPQCGVGGAPCQSCPRGCCDVGGSCQSGNTIENCASASGTCQTCNDRLEVCLGDQCEVCEHDCPCQGQSVCAGATLAPNTPCGTTQTGHECKCMVKSNFEPVCVLAPFQPPCTLTCALDSHCQVCYGPLAVCVLGGPRCDVIPGTATNFCAFPCHP